MTAIVMNTLTGAVTEHSIEFQSLTANRFGSENGLFSLGGADDNGEQIEARFVTPRSSLGSPNLKGVGFVYFAMTGDAGSSGQLLVQDDEGEEYAYEFALRDKGASRARAGQGLRENTLAIGFANLDGADFRIDSIEADITDSKTRRQS